MLHESFNKGDVPKIAGILWLPALIALLAAFFLWYLLNTWLRPRAPAPVASAQAVVPTVSGAVIGPAQVVFDTSESCELIDVPDAPARAFRDDRGIVHLIASHYVARAMIGRSLDQLSHTCRIIYRSPKDTDPSHF